MDRIHVEEPCTGLNKQTNQLKLGYTPRKDFKTNKTPQNTQNQPVSRIINLSRIQIWLKDIDTNLKLRFPTYLRWIPPENGARILFLPRRRFDSPSIHKKGISPANFHRINQRTGKGVGIYGYKWLKNSYSDKKNLPKTPKRNRLLLVFSFFTSPFHDLPLFRECVCILYI